MRGVRGFLAGVLGLVALEVLVTSKQAPDAVGGAFGLAAGTLRVVVSPNVPAIPDRRRGETYGVASGVTSPGQQPPSRFHGQPGHPEITDNAK